MRIPVAWRMTDDGESNFTDRADVADYWRSLGLTVTELFE